jgi:beta-glucosidase
MERRNWLKLSGAGALGTLLPTSFMANWLNELGVDEETFRLSQFGSDFLWGAACAAYQVEGAWNLEGKGASIWDTFTHKKGNVHNNENADVAVDFYHRYKEDIAHLKAMNLKVFRFSIAWSRIFPEGVGIVNPKGVAFYHEVIDECLREGIQPWVTLYHWDLPQVLQDKGGWTNREVLKWFEEYVTFCAKEFGMKVKNWMIMNEPAAFVGLGYMLGYHAPGKKGITNFLKATHHVCLCMALGGKIVRKEVAHANIGTTFSCSYVEPVNDKGKNQRAAERIDALVNRLYIEPTLGLGYPYDVFPALKRIENYFEPGDQENLAFDFDFIGVQNYFRVVGKQSLFPPVMFAKEVPATKREVPVNEMNFEVYPEGMYKILKQFGEYKQIKNIIVTENGVCYEDHLVNGKVHDEKRIQFFKDYLANVLKAKNEGVPVTGYFVWSLTDNFEWSEGYHPRFGLVYVDFATQQRTVKDSGLWFQKELAK